MLQRRQPQADSGHGFAGAIARHGSAIFLFACIGNAAAADFCYNGSTPCRDTFEEAEADMRADYPAIGPLLEPKHVELLANNGLRFNYFIKPQPAATLYAPSYKVHSGDLFRGGYGCKPPADVNQA